MRTSLQEEKKDLTIFGQSPSLFFQFILSEFISTFSEVQKIQETYEEMEGILIQSRLLEDVSPQLDSILDRIFKLCGQAVTEEREFTWNTDKGTLCKLRRYCYQFAQEADPNEKSIVNLSQCIGKAYHAALQAREVINYLHKENINQKKLPDYALLYPLLDRLIDNLHRSSRLILRILTRYKEDENIVYFLLRNKEALDKIYKTNFVAKLFRKMYPGGIQDAREVLLGKYSQRGFKDLLNTIAKQIADLQPARAV